MRCEKTKWPVDRVDSRLLSFLRAQTETSRKMNEARSQQPLELAPIHDVRIRGLPPLSVLRQGRQE